MTQVLDVIGVENVEWVESRLEEAYRPRYHPLQRGNTLPLFVFDLLRSIPFEPVSCQKSHQLEIDPREVGLIELSLTIANDSVG